MSASLAPLSMLKPLSSADNVAAFEGEMEHEAAPRRQHVVVIGGGFGGLAAVRALRDVAVDITLVDRSNHHLFQPLLYQVATGSLSPANIAAPLRGLLRTQANARMLLAGVREIDVEARELRGDGLALHYDVLVVATGTHHDYFGQDWAALAPGLKTIADATTIRRRILGAFEMAELIGPEAEVAGWLTFVVVGGGPTGMELAGALAEIARHTMRGEFRAIDATRACVVLIEAAPQILPSYRAGLAKRARDALEGLGVAVRTSTRVTDVREDAVVVEHEGLSEIIRARTVLWAAGVRASHLGPTIAEQTGAEVDRAGRLPVGADLTVAGHPDIFVIGDLALARDTRGVPYPGLAPVAIQQGRYVAQVIARRLRGEDVPRFHFRDGGTMAVVGRGFAIADLRHIRLWGFPGWVAWALLHLAQIVEFENRLLVFVQWLWSYWTRNGSARLIIGPLPHRASASMDTRADEDAREGPV